MTTANPPQVPSSPTALPTRLALRLRPLAIVRGSSVAPASRWGLFVVIVLVVLGCGGRLAAWSRERSLWIDEAMLALNLIERSPPELLQPLDYNQGAPPGFLVAVKVAMGLGGSAEWALRLVPMVASLVGLVGFAVLAWRLLPAPAAQIAVALGAGSPHLISYAGECKQYAGDATVTIGLFLAAMGVLQGRGGWRWALLAFGGAIAVWCSHPAVFILGGIGTALGLQAVQTRHRSRRRAVLVTISTWLVSFTLCYFLCLKELSQNHDLTRYWTDHFWPLPPQSLGDLTWLVEHALQFFTQPGGFGGTLVPLGGLAAVLALIGWREWLREHWVMGLAAVGPIAWLLVASGLQKYPVGGRLMLFWVPVALLLVARGAWSVINILDATHPWAARLLLGVLVLAPWAEAVVELRRPARCEELAPVLQRLRGEWQPGEQVYVYYGAIPAFRYYTRNEPWPAAVVYGGEHRGRPAGYRDELAGLRGPVWLIVSHRHGDEEAVIRTWLACRGVCEREIHAPGAAAYRYRLPD